VKNEAFKPLRRFGRELCFIFVASLLASGSLFAAVQPLDRLVAIVDNDLIMQSQLNQRMAEVRQTIQKRDDMPMPDEATLRQQVLERLILESIQLQIGERAAIRINDEELGQAMQTIAARNNLTLEQFRAALAQDGLSFDTAREQVRREMIISRVRQHQVGGRIQVSEQEVQNFLNSEVGKLELSEEYHLAHILVPIAESASTQSVQEATRKATDLYQKLRQGADFAQAAMMVSASESALEGGDMGWRKAAELPSPFDREVSLMRPGDVTEPVRIPGGFVIVKLLEKRGGETPQMRNETHVRHILLRPSEIRSDAETRRLAERLYQRIQNGEDFTELAQRFSEDPGSVREGGDMGWVTADALEPEFRQVMENSPKDLLSKPFQSTYGWHVLQVLDRRSVDNREQIRQQQAFGFLRARKYDEELQAWLRQIRDETYVEIKP